MSEPKSDWLIPALIIGGIFLLKKSDGDEGDDSSKSEEPIDEEYTPPPPDNPPPDASRKTGGGDSSSSRKTGGGGSTATRETGVEASFEAAKSKVTDWWTKIEAGDDTVEDMPTYGPDPNDPTSVPTQGQYYQVKDGDNPTNIAKAAGLEGWQWKKIRDHELNAWFPKKHKSGSPFPGFSGDGIPVFKWFDPPGWNTVMHTYPKPEYVFLRLYIPTAAEIEG